MNDFIWLGKYFSDTNYRKTLLERVLVGYVGVMYYDESFMRSLLTASKEILSESDSLWVPLV